MLRGPTTTIVRIAAGLSSAGVYRVDAGGNSCVLKIAGPHDAVDAWRARTAMQRTPHGQWAYGLPLLHASARL